MSSEKEQEMAIAKAAFDAATAEKQPDTAAATEPPPTQSVHTPTPPPIAQPGGEEPHVPPPPPPKTPSYPTYAPTPHVPPPPERPAFKGPPIPVKRGSPGDEPIVWTIGDARCDSCGQEFDVNGFDRRGVIVQPIIGFNVPDAYGTVDAFRLICGNCMANGGPVKNRGG